MNIFKNKQSSVFVLFLVLFFVVVAVHADTGQRSFFAGDPGLFESSYSLGLNNLPAMEQSGSINAKPRVSLKKFTLEVLAGIIGNIAFAYAGGSLGHYFEARSEHDSLPGAFMGLTAGSVGGSTLGVYLAGNAGNVRGKFGMALLGGFLGEVSAWLICGLTTAHESDDWTVGALSFAILPPIGAVIMFNSSLRYRSLPGGNGLLNLSKDKLTLGIPDIHIRPIAAYGKNMKTEFQFKINMLSVMF